MEFRLQFLFLCFIFSIVSWGSHAADQTLSPEMYWKQVLPNTPMPKAISHSLHPEWMDNKGTSVTVGKGGVGVHTGKPYGHGSVHYKTSWLNRITARYATAAADTQLHDDPKVAIFFLRKDLKPGTKMTLHFPRSDGSAAFVPRRTASSIPFSSAEFATILRRFSVSPGSEEAAGMKETIRDCERNHVAGEEKYCPTSLESMVDFAVSKLGGRSLTAVSTDASADDGRRKEFSVTAVREVRSGDVVACHKETYPYAVFYCHKTKNTVAYTVELAAEGKVVEAAATCHKDTAAWNPKHLAFQLLKVKPGSVPICHILPEETVLWVGN